MKVISDMGTVVWARASGADPKRNAPSVISNFALLIITPLHAPACLDIHGPIHVRNNRLYPLPSYL